MQGPLFILTRAAYNRIRLSIFAYDLPIRQRGSIDQSLEDKRGYFIRVIRVPSDLMIRGKSVSKEHFPLPLIKEASLPQ